jgi:hypothetical protein
MSRDRLRMRFAMARKRLQEISLRKMVKVSYLILHAVRCTCAGPLALPCSLCRQSHDPITWESLSLNRSILPKY